MVEQLSNRPLFQRILGSEFEQLPEPIRSLHAVTTLTLAEGRCTVTRGGNVLARLLARLLSLPPDCRDGKIQLVMRRRGELEVWVRTIAGRRFVSTLRQSGPGQVTERIGPVDFDFALRPGATELAMSLRAVRVFGLSLPQRLWPRITARETVADGRFRFDIVTSLPGIGQIVAYSGTLAAIEDRAGAFAGRPVVLFDGICNLCNRSVNFLLRWDHEGGIRYSAMQSDPGRRLLRRHGLPKGDYDSFVVLDGDKVLCKSAAILHLVGCLGWPWRLVGAFSIVPQAIRDWTYDLVARNRYRLMGTRTSCRVPTPEERERFLV